MRAPLDPGFRAAIEKNREHRLHAVDPLVIGLEREAGLCSRYETVIDTQAPDAFRYAERLVKFLLWSRGGWRVSFGGPPAIGERIRRAYAAGGERAFDAALMSRVYGHNFAVEVMAPEGVPPARESTRHLGGHLDGSRIGFDLGASDYKVAAVRDGEVLYSEELHWNPKDAEDPEYHYRHLRGARRVKILSRASCSLKSA